jgi:NAD(P)-dependent dehydrogenase (short-subunit alcohol dehydrogenase family)
MGALEETTIDEIKAQFETNFFGAIRVIQRVIPMMRKQGGGIIVNITSLGGRISFPLNSPYHATKFALEGLSMQYHLFIQRSQYSVRVVLVFCKSSAVCLFVLILFPILGVLYEQMRLRLSLRPLLMQHA